MKIIINSSKQSISITNNDNAISKLYFIPSFFVWEFSSVVSKDNPLIITKYENEVFYENILWLMHQNYQFSNKQCIKTKDTLIWLSEHCYDLEDEFQVDITPRLIIEKESERFNIFFSIPYLERHGIKNAGAAISFTHAENGYYSKNTITNTNLQDDLIKVFFSTLDNKLIETPKKLIIK